MMKMIPFHYPPITSYPVIANNLGILWSYKKEVLPWFADHFIQLVAEDTPNILNNNEYDLISFYEGVNPDNNMAFNDCPFFYESRVDRIVFDSHINSFSDFIITSIDNGYCFETIIDNYYLPCSTKYKKDHYYHSTLIYGYDSSSDTVYLADFLENGKYVTNHCNFDEINRGYASVPIMSDIIPSWMKLTFMKKYVEANYKVNVQLLYRFLSDYILSRDSFDKYKYSFSHGNRKLYFGIDSYMALVKHCLSNKDLDIISFHVMYDHKVAMKLRCQYLHKEGLLTESFFEDNLVSIDLLISNILKIRNMAIKFTITENKKIMSRIIELLYEYQLSDLAIHKKIIDNLLLN